LGPAFVAITGWGDTPEKGQRSVGEICIEAGFLGYILTNGYLMNPELAEQLIGSGVKRIEISLDGSYPEIHDKVRGRGWFFSQG